MDDAGQNPLFLADEAATLALGASWSACLSAPLTVYLQGGLGAGKTTFVRGLLRALGHEAAVKSPTYAIVESYSLPQGALHHFDLYRLSASEEWDDAGLDDLVGASINLIEWPQQGAGYAPEPDLTFALDYEGEGRSFAATAHTAAGKQSLEAWLTQN